MSVNWAGGATGAASGAAMGSAFGPWGTAIGGVGGGLIGLFAGGGGSSSAGNAQQASLDEAMKRLQAGSAEQYQRRMKDLETTMSFYGPAQRYLESIYGGAATGPQALAKGPPGMGGPTAPPPGFPKPQGPPTPATFNQGPRRGF